MQNKHRINSCFSLQNNDWLLHLEQNIFLAKRNLIDNVYSNARMEGINVTFPQTQTILEGVNVPNLKLDDIQCILNLRDAWRYVINTINEELISSKLYTSGQPDPDLLIRTSGEIRLSNFLPWQLVYSEFLFIEKYWPDFNEEDLDAAIVEYQKRTRKFGAN